MTTDEDIAYTLPLNTSLFHCCRCSSLSPLPPIPHPTSFHPRDGAFTTIDSILTFCLTCGHSPLLPEAFGPPNMAKPPPPCICEGHLVTWTGSYTDLLEGRTGRRADPELVGVFARAVGVLPRGGGGGGGGGGDGAPAIVAAPTGPAQVQRSLPQAVLPRGVTKPPIPHQQQQQKRSQGFPGRGPARAQFPFVSQTGRVQGLLGRGRENGPRTITPAPSVPPAPNVGRIGGLYGSREGGSRTYLPFLPASQAGRIEGLWGPGSGVGRAGVQVGNRSGLERGGMVGNQTWNARKEKREKGRLGTGTGMRSGRGRGRVKFREMIATTKTKEEKVLEPRGIPKKQKLVVEKEDEWDGDSEAEDTPDEEEEEEEEVDDDDDDDDEPEYHSSPETNAEEDPEASAITVSSTSGSNKISPINNNTTLKTPTAMTRKRGRPPGSGKKKIEDGSELSDGDTIAVALVAKKRKAPKGKVELGSGEGKKYGLRSRK